MGDSLLMQLGRERMRFGGIMRQILLMGLVLGVLARMAVAQPDAEEWLSDASGTNYVGVVHRELGAATGSVMVVMFEMRVPDDAADSSPSLLLVNDLIAAHRRGVDVRVMLNLRSRYDPASDAPARDYANGVAADMLVYAGVDVAYSPASYHMHVKLVVIDETTVILGSHNWTYSALQRNTETSSLIRSPEHARAKLAYIEEVQTISAAAVLAPDVRKTIAVPRNFLLLENLGPHMLTNNDERPFEVYLLLLRYAAERGSPTLSIDPIKVATDLAIAPDDDKWVKRKYIIKALRTLADRYELIEVTFHRGKDADVTIKQDASLASAGYIQVPLAYWTYGLATSLKQGELHAYMICLSEESEGLTPPLWRKNQEDLADMYSISRASINIGLNALQRRDLLTIFRDKIPANPKATRRPNGYRLKRLLSPEARAAKWEALEQTHSPERVAEARQLAAMINFGNDFDCTDQLAVAIRKYGYQAVRDATTMVAAKSVTNPHRHPDSITDALRRSNATR
jgi:hypothetical protein